MNPNSNLPALSSLFSLSYVYTLIKEYTNLYPSLPLTGFEPGHSGAIRNDAVHCVTTNQLSHFLFFALFFSFVLLLYNSPSLHICPAWLFVPFLRADYDSLESHLPIYHLVQVNEMSKKVSGAAPRKREKEEVEHNFIIGIGSSLR